MADTAVTGDQIAQNQGSLQSEIIQAIHAAGLADLARDVGFMSQNNEIEKLNQYDGTHLLGPDRNCHLLLRTIGFLVTYFSLALLLAVQVDVALCIFCGRGCGIVVVA